MGRSITDHHELSSISVFVGHIQCYAVHYARGCTSLWVGHWLGIIAERLRDYILLFKIYCFVIHALICSLGLQQHDIVIQIIWLTLSLFWTILIIMHC